MITITPPSVDVSAITQLLDRLDPTPSTVCTVAGCVHHHAVHDVVDGLIAA